MRMVLKVLERVLLLDILPGEGDITSIRIVRKLREALSFSEEEHQRLSLTFQGDQIRWDLEAAKGLVKEVEIGPKARKVIVGALERLNTERKVREDLIDLYETFIPTACEE